MARQFKIVAKNGGTDKTWYRDNVVQMENTVKAFNHNENNEPDNFLYVPFENLRFVEQRD